MEYPYESLFLEVGLGEGIVAKELAGSAFDPSGSFGLDLWVKLTDCNTTKNFLSKDGVFSLCITKNMVAFCAQGYETVTAQDAIWPNAWVHIALSCYHGNVRIFLDGDLTVEKMVTGTGVSNENPVKIGADCFGAFRFLRVYQTALTAQEVKAAMYQYTVSANMSAFYEFTSSPPKELKSGQTLTLPQSCQIMCAMPAAQYDNNNGWLDVSQSLAVNPAGKRDTPYTVQLWVRLDSDAQTQVYTLFYNGDSDGMAGMELSLVKSGEGYHLQAVHWMLDSTVQSLEATKTVGSGQWVNLAVTWQNKTLTLYQDGAQVAQKTEVATPEVALTKKRTLFGARMSRYSPNGENLFAGCISRVDVWDKALTSTELKTYAAQEPDWDADGLTGTWSFFTGYVANRVDSLPVSRVNDLRIEEYQIPAVTGQGERQMMLQNSESEPLSPEQLADCRERAFSKAADSVFDSPMGLRANTCQVGDMVYFVLHDETHSYTACSLPAELLEDDPMLQWYIELVLILLGAAVSLLFSMNLSYNVRLGTYLRLEVVGNPQLLMLLSTVRDASGAIAFFISFFKTMITENKLWQLLTLCVKIGFWGLLSGLTKLVAKVFGGPVAWATWLMVTSGIILYHLSKKPKKSPDLVITSILFNHRKAGSICSINIRKNEMTTWPLPEWQPGTETQRVPAVYRIARFTANTDPLQIAAEFASSDMTPHTVSIRGVAIGANATVTGDTNAVAVAMVNGRSGLVYFTLANHTLHQGGIRRADISWRWEQQKAGGWETIKVTNHRLYTILDSVNLPWSSLPNQVNNPWTDCLDVVFNWVTGQLTPQAVASTLTTSLYASGRILYQGVNTYATAIEVNNTSSKAFSLTMFLAHWNRVPAQTLRFNCEDCAEFIVTFGNLFGCDLWQVGLGSDFAVPNILLIGEVNWRLPDAEHLGPGFFNFHVVACESMNNGANHDPTQYNVYDPCQMYHNQGGVATLAQNVQLSQYAVMPAIFPATPAPLPGFYREDFLANTQQGIGQCQIGNVRRVYLA